MLDRVTGWIAQTMDAAVRLQLGTLPMDPPAPGSFDPAAPDDFWRASSVLDPLPVTAGPVLLQRGGGDIDLRILEGRSHGPGGHPGSRKLFATAHLRAGRRDLPFILIIHGFAVPIPWYEEWQCRALSTRGASTARVDLPFHLRRRPRHAGSGDGFLSPDLIRTRDSVRQSVEDAAAVVAWARENVSDRVTVLGISLGGLIACLLAAHVELDGMVALAPFCDPPETFLEHLPMRTRRRLGIAGESGGVWGGDRAAARAVVEAALAPIVPKNFTPATPGERITLVRPTHDAIVGAGPIATLARTWGTELWDLRHGHISVMNARGLNARIQRRLLHPRARADEGDILLAG